MRITRPETQSSQPITAPDSWYYHKYKTPTGYVIDIGNTYFGESDLHPWTVVSVSFGVEYPIHAECVLRTTNTLGEDGEVVGGETRTVTRDLKPEWLFESREAAKEYTAAKNLVGKQFYLNPYVKINDADFFIESVDPCTYQCKLKPANLEHQHRMESFLKAHSLDTKYHSEDYDVHLMCFEDVNDLNQQSQETSEDN